MNPAELVKGENYILNTGVHLIEVVYVEHTVNHRIMKTSNNIKIPLSEDAVKSNLTKKE